MVGDRWGISATWNMWGAAIYGGLIGPPLQVVQDALTNDEPGLAANPEYLLWGVIAGSVAFVLAAHARNRIIRKADDAGRRHR